jgi:GNAT superfamily N-acetyltransferase
VAISIRFANSNDAELILGFIRGLADYEHEPGAVQTTAASLRAQMEATEPPFECLIAERDGEAAGFALFFRNYSTWSGRPGLYLEDLFVRQAHRGHGVGKALLKQPSAIAAQRGWARMEWAVLDWNTPALGFYRALGALPKDQWTVWRLDGAALARVAHE